MNYTQQLAHLKKLSGIVNRENFSEISGISPDNPLYLLAFDNLQLCLSALECVSPDVWAALNTYQTKENHLANQD